MAAMKAMKVMKKPKALKAKPEISARLAKRPTQLPRTRPLKATDAGSTMEPPPL